VEVRSEEHSGSPLALADVVISGAEHRSVSALAKSALEGRVHHTLSPG